LRLITIVSTTTTTTIVVFSISTTTVVASIAIFSPPLLLCLSAVELLSDDGLLSWDVVLLSEVELPELSLE
jgi:hypothetical protein